MVPEFTCLAAGRILDCCGRSGDPSGHLVLEEGVETAKKWFPLALGLSLLGSFSLWYAMNDYERARYFALLAGLPVSVFALLGFIKEVRARYA